jgi:hypothetical protein
MSALEGWRRDRPQPGGKVAMARLVHSRIDDSFRAIMSAWSNRQADALRPYASRDCLRRARLALDRLDDELRVERIEDAELRDVAVQRPRGSARDEEVRGYVLFTARAWTEDLRTGSIIAGDDATAHAFAQRWTFVFEVPRGWVLDRVERLWSGSGEAASFGDCGELPAGWYSRPQEPTTWVRWDGGAWAGRREGSSQARP